MRTIPFIRMIAETINKKERTIVRFFFEKKRPQGDAFLYAYFSL